tara:strand:+ start:105 stop:356 length:252 start_codon:yes stop_codon:yes gene_type:complete
VTFEAANLIQFVPQYEDLAIADMREHDPKNFASFEEECEQDVIQGITELATHHVEYSGQMLKGMKEGKGSKYFKHAGGDFYHG